MDIICNYNGNIQSAYTTRNGVAIMVELNKAHPLDEISRKYVFADREIRIEKPYELIVSDSGTHRLRAGEVNGRTKLVIIPPKWLAIEIESRSNNWVV